MKTAKDGAKTQESIKSINTSELDKVPRTTLLLNVVQMLREDYPLPFDESNSTRIKDYVFTNAKYDQVTNKSPLFSIDCEMVFNIDGEMEVVWLAVVNESLECVYESYVKPRKKVHNYLTK